MKTISISINNEDIMLLKQNKYSLCLACDEDDMGYDVICIADPNYMLKNTISFYDEYRIFYCMDICDGKKLDIRSDTPDICVGQQITIDEYGLFKNAVSGRADDVFEIINEFGYIYPGFERRIGYQGGEDYLPVFVTPYKSIKGSYTIKPGRTVRIWFEQFASGGTFLSDFLREIVKAGQSTGIEVSLDKGPYNINYENGNWKI